MVIKIFLPYLTYMVSVIYYLTKVITETPTDPENKRGFLEGPVGHIVLRLLILILTILFTVAELQ
jgi:hypothetical protein